MRIVTTGKMLIKIYHEETCSCIGYAPKGTHDLFHTGELQGISHAERHPAKVLPLAHCALAC